MNINNNMTENGSADNMNHTNNTGNTCETIKPILTLAISTVPMQNANWDEVYSMEEALEYGSLFPELNLPFEGSGT